MNNDVCAVIVTYNADDSFRNTFDSVRQQAGEVVIVDNASGKSTIGLLRSLEGEDNVEVIYNAVNKGIAAAFNSGVDKALSKGFKWVLTLDQDSELREGMVGALLSCHGKLTRSGMGKIAVMAPNFFDKNISGGYKNTSGKRCARVRTAISSGSLINTEVFKHIGTYDEGLFLYYVDDDFCLRCLKAGWKIYRCYDAVLAHREGDRAVKKLLTWDVIYDKSNKNAMYYIARNTVLMVKRYFSSPGYAGSIIAKRFIADPVRTLLFSSDRRRDLKAMAEGFIDGIKGKAGPRP